MGNSSVSANPNAKPSAPEVSTHPVRSRSGDRGRYLTAGPPARTNVSDHARSSAAKLVCSHAIGSKAHRPYLGAVYEG
jgi:hypothetical protein